MMTIEIAAITGIAGAAGVLIGWGITWGKTKQTIMTLVVGQGQLRTDMMAHHDNRDIHIDPRRDDRATTDFRILVEKNFDDLKGSLLTLNNRCGDRGQECAGHFGRLESRISAATGKINGESGK